MHQAPPSPAAVRARRLRALDELRADVEVRMIDAQNMVTEAERARAAAAARISREDYLAYVVQLELLDHVHALLTADAPEAAEPEAAEPEAAA